MILGLVWRNAFRHKLRTLLTVAGLLVAILAFGLLSTVVGAWYAGAEAASAARLVTRNAISLTFPLPLAYKAKVRAIDGVKDITTSNWFGGIYKEPKNFFPQFAVEAESYLRLYPELVVEEDQQRAFLRDRRGCLVGAKLAERFGFKIGDIVPLRGTIFPGQWEFVVRGIYRGGKPNTDQNQMIVHWAYINETMTKRMPRRANQVGVFVTEIDPDRAAEVSLAIDKEFKNTANETLTETEKAFQLGFVSMTEAIVVAIRLVSYLVIGIILAVMANTMAMTVRERTAEYATLKALGFGPGFVAALIIGESLAITGLGGGLGMLATFPVAQSFGKAMGGLFPVFLVAPQTVVSQGLCTLAVGLIAAALPAWQASRVRIVEGLRAVA